MNVLYLAEQHLPLRGGTVTYAVNLVRELKQQGIDGHLLTFALPGHADAAPDVTFVPVPARLVTPGGGYARITAKLLPVLMRRTFRDVYARLQPDVIHILNGFYIDLLTRGVPAPVVWTINNVPPQEHALRVMAGRPGEWIDGAYRRAIAAQTYLLFRMYRWTRIIAPSEPTARLLTKVGVGEDDIRVIPHGVDAPMYREVPETPPRAKAVTLLSVAGIARNKGYDVLAHALPQVIARFPSVRVRVVGEVRDPAYAALLRSDIERLGLNDRWEFAGRVADVRPYLAGAHVYVQPSREEGFCLAVLEALAAGRFVVASAVGEIPRMVTKDTGLLVSPDDADRLAAALIDALSRVLRAWPSRQAFDSAVRPYTWPEIAHRTAEVYREVIARK